MYFSITKFLSIISVIGDVKSDSGMPTLQQRFVSRKFSGEHSQRHILWGSKENRVGQKK